ncbi:caprin-2-like isoform X3 [Crassostrea angulata]|uniref:caprin-2-like isoform X3 n=1 Tax=Magallana angulata TaxID=2784310 RepID=UPI0022B132AA|nr:caprin-2-like isoform X3 [Crassostrea angulata]
MAVVVCLILHLIISTVSGLDSDVWKKEIDKRLSSLEEFNVHLQEENANLRSLISETQRENKILKRELNNIAERVSKCEEVILRQDEDTNRSEEIFLETRESEDWSKISSRKNSQPGPRIVPPDSYPVSAVAFYGYLSQSSAPNLPPHHPIVYDTVIINRANGYNNGDGIFIAPVTGVYAFHFSVCVINGPEVPWASLEISLSGNSLGSTFENSVASGYHCSSTLIVSDVHDGDHVFIRTHENTRGHIYSSPAGRTSFSGWLLYR